MTFNFRIPRQIAAGVVIVTLVAVTAAVAMGLSYPEPVSSGALGPDWQCTRLAFVFTSCTRVVRFKTAAAGEEGKASEGKAPEGKAPSCPRPRSWRNALGLLR